MPGGITPSGRRQRGYREHLGGDCGVVAMIRLLIGLLVVGGRRLEHVAGVVVPAIATPWGDPLWVAIYRRKVAHRTAKNFQLDLFDPNDGYYEYSAVTSNLGFTLANLWFFMAGRGNHGRPLRSSRAGLPFTPSRRWPTPPTVPGSSSSR